MNDRDKILDLFIGIFGLGAFTTHRGMVSAFADSLIRNGFHRTCKACDMANGNVFATDVPHTCITLYKVLGMKK